MPVSERGGRRGRICSQTRSSLLPDSVASAPRYDRISPQIRLRLLPRSLAGIGRVLGKNMALRLDEALAFQNAFSNGERIS